MSDNKYFKHSSRSFFDFYNSLKTKYPKKPDWLFAEFAGGMEILSETLNAIANDIIDPVTRDSAYFTAALSGYTPVEADGAVSTVTLTLPEEMDKKLSAGYQIGAISQSTGGLITYELVADAASNGTKKITAEFKQKKTEKNVRVAQIDAQEDFMEYGIDGYAGIIKDSVFLTINGARWNSVSNFDNASPDDMVFVPHYKSDGTCKIMFGDGKRGMRPPLNAPIYANFETTLGMTGLVNANELVINIGNDPDIVKIENTASAGGSSQESVPSIKRNSRSSTRLREIVWTEEDLELCALASGAGAVKAKGIGMAGNGIVYIVPSGGGNPSADMKLSVQDFIKGKSLFGVMPVVAHGANYEKVNITAQVSIRQGYNSETVKKLCAFALTLASSAYDVQVLDSYFENGIDKTRREVINLLWSWSFTEADNDALESTVLKWSELLGNRDFREFGQPLEIGDLWIIGDNLNAFGVDEFSLTSPSSNVNCSTLTYIIDTGTVSVS